MKLYRLILKFERKGRPPYMPSETHYEGTQELFENSEAAEEWLENLKYRNLLKGTETSVSIMGLEEVNV